jgi:hypothetical protein
MGFFKKKLPPPTPMERTLAAIDELNAALIELRKEEEHRRLRPWVRPGDARLRTSAKVMLGFWDSNHQQMIIIYGED